MMAPYLVKTSKNASMHASITQKEKRNPAIVFMFNPLSN